MLVYFCHFTGARLVAPGVSKTIDPVNGQDEFVEEAHVAPKTKSESKAESAEDSASKPAKSGK